MSIGHELVNRKVLKMLDLEVAKNKIKTKAIKESINYGDDNILYEVPSPLC